MKKIAFIITFMMFVSLLFATSQPVLKVGDWSFRLNKINGYITNLKYKKHDVAQVMFRQLYLNGKYTDKFPVNSYKIDKTGQKLSLYFSIPNWNICEHITFDAGTAGMIRRSLELTNLTKQDMEFSNYTTRTQLTGECDYFLPGSVLGDIRSYSYNRNDPIAYRNLVDTKSWRGNTSKLPPGTQLNPAYHGGYLLIFQNTDKDALVFFPDDRFEAGVSSFKTSNKSLEVKQTVYCNGWALPGKTQYINGNGLIFCKNKTPEQALLCYADALPVLGFIPPGGMPDWVHHGMVYELRLDFTPGENGIDRYIAELPRIKALGYNILYVQPIMEGRHLYLPRTQRDISSLITEKKYRQFVKAAHENGLRVWQDIIPHGSRPKEIMLRGLSAINMAFNKDGTLAGGSYKTDYMSPVWQNYMYETALNLMKYGIDGFRIDMPYGSGRNWRKKGCPTLKNVLEKFPKYQMNDKIREWITESFKSQPGGVMPPLPYERASLPNRTGGIKMSGTIRKAAKEIKRDSAVLSETLPPVYLIGSDAIYDLLYDLMTYNFCMIEPEQFTPALSRYFHEKKCVSPKGGEYLRVFQSHDVTRPFAFLGTGAGRAAYATAALSRGLPLIYRYMDIGHGDFIARLQEVRAKHPELNQGKIDYLGVKTAPGVWSAFHGDTNRFSVPLVNFTSREIKTTVKLPVEAPTLFNEMTGDIVAKNTAEFNITLAPYETAVIVTECKLPPTKKTTPGKRSYTKLRYKSKGDIITVENNYWKALFNRNTGLLTELRNSNGVCVLNNFDIITPNTYPKKKASLKLSKSSSEIRIDSTITIGNASVLLSYHCKSDGIYLDASLKNSNTQPYVALVLPMKNYLNGSWRVATADGVLSDRFLVPVYKSDYVAARTETRYYRDYCWNVLFDSESRLFNLNCAVAGLYDEKNAGFEMSIPDPLRSAPAQVTLQRKTGPHQEPGMVLYFKTPSVLTSGLPESFSIKLTAVSEKQPVPPIMKPFRAGGVTLSSESSGLIIENKYYKMRQRRNACAIRELIDKKTGNILLRNMLTEAEELIPKKLVSTRFDADAGMVVRLQGNSLYCRTLGQFVTGGLHPTPRNCIWEMREHIYNESNTIMLRTGIRQEATAKIPNVWDTDNVKVIWKGIVPNNTTLNGNSANIKGSNGKDVLILSGDGRPFSLLEKNGEKILCYSLLRNGVNIPQKTYEQAIIKMSIGGENSGEAPKFVDFSFLQNKNELEIFPFDAYAFTHSYLNGKIPYEFPQMYAPDYMLKVRDNDNSAAYCRNVLYDGKATLKMFGTNRLPVPPKVKFLGAYWFHYSLKNMTAGKYRISFHMKHQNNIRKGRIQVRLQGIPENKKEISSRWLKSFSIPENSDWQEYSVDIDQPVALSLPKYCVIIDDSGPGIYYFSDIKVTRLK